MKSLEETNQMLVATDVAARGLMLTILLVVNYQLPDEIKYNHRSGRTGRAGKLGTSIVIVTKRIA
jgi:ATP-dependent RNA helicase DeaD